MKNTLLLAIASLVFFSSSLLATETVSQKLPFIGESYFNFAGGSGTGEFLKINQNGQYLLGGCGKADCIVSSKGKYSNPLPTGDEDGSKYLIHKNTIYKLKENGEVETDCLGDGAPCAQELEPVNSAPEKPASAKIAFKCVTSTEQSSLVECLDLGYVYEGDSDFRNAIINSLKKSKLPAFKFDSTGLVRPIVIHGESFIYGSAWSNDTSHKVEIDVLYSLKRNIALGQYHKDYDSEHGKLIFFGNPSTNEQQVLRDINNMGNPIGDAAMSSEYPIIVN